MARKMKVLFDILKACVTSGGYDAADFTEQDLRQLYRYTHKQDLAHMVAPALMPKSLLENTPAGNLFLEETEKALYRHTLLEIAYDEICTALDKGKIDYLPLKGAVIRWIYPQPWMRTSCDIDILVRKDSLADAVSTIRTLGYELEKETDRDVSLFSSSGVHLELHFTLCEKAEPMDRVLERVWDFASPCHGETHQYRLTNEYLLFHHIAHTAFHFYTGGCGIKPMIDFWLMRGKISADTEKLHSLLVEAGLTKFHQGLQALVDTWFGDVPYTDLTLQMSKYIFGGGTYGTVQNSILVKRRKGAGNMKFLIYRLFPPYSHMRNRNKVLEKWPVLLPVFWFTRLVSRLLPGKADEAVGEMKFSSGISQEQLSGTNQMLAELGLFEVRKEL